MAENKKLYLSLPKKQKMLVAQNLVLGVRSLKPPGRFLHKDAKTGLWEDIGDAKAHDKASQALREGAPDIRDVLHSKETESQQDDKGTMDPFLRDHVVEVGEQTMVIFDALSHATETQKFLTELHNPKLFSSKFQTHEPVPPALQQTSFNNSLNNTAAAAYLHNMTDNFVSSQNFLGQHSASGLPYYAVGQKNSLVFPAMSHQTMLDPFLYMDPQSIPPQQLLRNFVSSRVSNNLSSNRFLPLSHTNCGSGQTSHCPLPESQYRYDTVDQQPPSKANKRVLEQGRNHEGRRSDTASKPLGLTNTLLKDDHNFRHDNSESTTQHQKGSMRNTSSENTTLKEHQHSGSEKDSPEVTAEMEALARASLFPLPSAEDFLPAVALASAASAYSKCREYESKVMKRSIHCCRDGDTFESSQTASCLPIHMRDFLGSTDAPSQPITCTCSRDVQHLLKPISIADFLNVSPQDAKNCKMSLVDSDDEDEDASWEILRKSLSEHNRPSNINTSQLAPPPFESLSSKDSSGFPIPLSRGTSLPIISALWNIMGGESGGSASGLLTLSRACSQTLYASSESSCQGVEDSTKESSNTPSS